jgi:hypothetical protein
MNRIVYFLMVGLAFTVLQVSTVTAAPVLTIGDPACQTPPAIGCPAGSPGLMAPPMGDPNMPPTAAPMGAPHMPPTAAPMGAPHMPPTAAPMGAPHMPPTAAPMGAPHMPPTAAPMGAPDGDHPPGEHHDGPPIDPRSGQPFAEADEAKFQKYADECEATKGLLSEGSTQELVAEGFTRIQVEKLCKDGPEHHDGPPPGEHHDGPPPGEHHDGPPPGEHHDGPPPGEHHDGPPPGEHHDGPPPGEHHDGPPPGDKTGEFGTPPDNGAPRTDGL